MRKLLLTSAIVFGAALIINAAQAQTFASLLSPQFVPQQDYTPQYQYSPQQQYAPEAITPLPEDEPADVQVDPRLRRQIVDYRTKEPPGTIIV